MLNVFEKIIIGYFVFYFIIMFICLGIILYEYANGNDKFFAKKVYIVNQDFCKEAK